MRVPAILVLIAVSLPLTLGAKPADSPGETRALELYLGRYFAELAEREVGLVLPRGHFTVQAEVKVDPAELADRPKPEDTRRIQLPLSNEFVMPMDFDPRAPRAESLVRYLSAVKRLRLIVGVAPSVPETVRHLISEELAAAVRLNPRKGDSIVLRELPPELNPGEGPAGPSLPLAALAASILAAALVLASALRRSAREVARELGVPRGREATFAEPLPAPRETLALPLPGGGFGGQPHGPQVWETAELEAIRAFLLDCAEEPGFEGAAKLALNACLSPERAAELEPRLPAGFADRVAPEGTEPVSPQALTQAFSTHLDEYRRAAHSPLGRLALELPLEELGEALGSLGSTEALVLLGQLTPLRRLRTLRSLDLEARAELALEAQNPHSAQERRAAEEALGVRLEELRSRAGGAAARPELAHLTTALLQPESFEQDERLFDRLGGSEVPGFASPLEALGGFAESDWAEIGVQELALAFHGYSEGKRGKVAEKLSGKRLEWLKGLVEQLVASPEGFRDERVVAARRVVFARLARARAAARLSRAA
jgi:hypothetical protein